MNTLPKISVITPTYNQGAYIERSIRSVLEQDYANVEYIVVDGGSTDETTSILRRYEGRLRWISEKDEGQTDAINKGIRMSSGEIIAYLNSDDVYEPGAFSQISAYFSNHPEVMWLTGKCRIIDEQGREVRRLITAYKNCLLKHFSYRGLLVTNPISQPATFWRRTVVEECGVLDTNEHLVMDYEYWLRIGKKFPPAILPVYLAAFRVHDASKTTRSFVTTFRRELEIARGYSRSMVLNFIHYLNYVCISSVYLMLNSAAQWIRWRKKNADHRE